MCNRFNRRRFLAFSGGIMGATLWPSTRPVFSLQSEPASVLHFYVGTYTDGESRGIYHCSFDPAGGAVKVLGATAGITNPSFLATSPRGGHLFAVSETPEYRGKPGGSVHAFAIDDTSGTLRHLNAQPSHGADPAHLSVDRRGRFLLVANYSGGNVCVFPIGVDGRLGPVVANVHHLGKGQNPRRQDRPHAHSVILDSANVRAFSADLGIDRIMVYTFDSESGALSPAGQPEHAMRPGAGPRHLDFSPDGKTLYAVNELDSTLAVLAYDPRSGSLSEVQTVSTLPPSFEGDNTCADVHAHPSGRFVYASNRGHDSIAVFAVQHPGGGLNPVQHQSTLGRIPRNFAIHPTGRFLLAANQKSDSIVVMRINEDDGLLTPMDGSASVPSPVCIRFVGHA